LIYQKGIEVGDTIKFSLLPSLQESVIVQVVALYQYPTFKELLTFLGYQGDALDEKMHLIYSFYSKQQEDENGVLGIKMKIIPEKES
jgi:ASC-1-like (ASCH) protein